MNARMKSVWGNLAVAFVLAAWTAGCQTTSEDALTVDVPTGDGDEVKEYKVNPEKEELRVQLVLDKQAYRPGEGLWARVEVTNLTDRTVTVRKLANDDMAGHAVDFLCSRADDKTNLPLRRLPVYSVHEKVGPEVEVGPGEKVDTRDFLLTRATEKPGKYLMVAQYNPQRPPGLKAGEKMSKGPLPSTMQKAYSAPVAFEVAGDRAFNRDEHGIIVKDDVINECLARLGRPVSASEARLVWDKPAGALIWWVCLTAAPETLSAGEQPKKAWFVNPYTGAFKPGEAPPQLEMEEAPAANNVQIRSRVPSAATTAPSVPSTPTPGLPQ